MYKKRGIIVIKKNLPIKDYIEEDAISRGFLFDVYRMPSLLHAYANKKNSHAFEIGDAVHVAVLEPHLYLERFIKGPVDRRGSKWKDAIQQADIEGKTLLVEKDFNKALDIANKALRNKDLQDLLNHPDTEKEITCFREFTGIMGYYAKARADILNKTLGIITDLKTTANVSEREFAASIAKFGYHVQSAFYLDIFNEEYYIDRPQHCQKFDKFLIIPIEKDDPFTTNTITMSGRAISAGRDTYLFAMRKLMSANGKRPGPQPYIADLPQWAYSDIEQKLMLEQLEGMRNV